jgi:hypothetical protein
LVRNGFYISLNEFNLLTGATKMSAENQTLVHIQCEKSKIAKLKMLAAFREEKLYAIVGKAVDDYLQSCKKEFNDMLKDVNI